MQLAALITYIITGTTSPVSTDTLPSPLLDSVIVEGFLHRSPLWATPAAVSVLRPADFNRFTPGSMVSALNSVPGMRMEERSPGSYRIAIRGSSLRSPFGVRNIRFYYDQFPFTDPGGNTYLNLFAPAALEQMEVLRGPAAALYGAGSGGALLAAAVAADSLFRVQATVSAGSNGLFQADGKLQVGNKNSSHQIRVHHQQAQGYRDHSSVERNYLSWKSSQQINENYRINSLVLYSKLQYRTPGGLTQAQFQENPKQARPASGIFPSAADARAAIYQESFFGGIHQTWKPSAVWELNALVYGAYHSIRNPAIRNYEKRTEPYLGSRATLGYTLPLSNSELRFTAGGEWQKGFYQVNVFGNRNGTADTLQTSDAVTPVNSLVFAQAQWLLPMGWEVQGGISWNRQDLRIVRESVTPNYRFSSSGTQEWAPRLSVSKRIKQWQLYALVAKGFSPPTTAEYLPSTSVINTSLRAEQGWNYEAGMRGRLWKQRIWLDANIFHFRLMDAIVQRRDDSGADFFTNAGSTRQWGAEINLRYQSNRNSRALIAEPWLSYTYHPFKYEAFKQIENDFSGNYLPGIAKHTIVAGIDWKIAQYCLLALTYQYTDPMWLNDANTARADAYQLLGARLDIPLVRSQNNSGKSWQLSWFGGADNLLNQRYSLGNDINAVGGRYFNAAVARNYFTGLRLH